MVKTAELFCCYARCLRTSWKQDSANVQIDIVELHKEAQQLIEHPRKETQLGQSQSIAD
ncbi:MAG: hypothetical protein O2900_14665 [Proteobacteria bacterium]|nr:hypothetical protein [Pseudomonadota bacterium]